MGSIIDETGKVYTRLTVLSKASTYNKKGAMWVCSCSCGNIVEVLGSFLRSGNTKSCGCLRLEKVTKHGLSKHRLYNFYNHAKNRCNNINDAKYPIYGGRGINFLFTSIEHFISCMGPSYQEGLTLDRIDVNSDYSPTNCRWVGTAEQALNKQNTIYVTIDSKKVTLKEASIVLNIPYKSLWKRYNKYGDNYLELSKPKKGAVYQC